MISINLPGPFDAIGANVGENLEPDALPAIMVVLVGEVVLP